MTILNNLGFWNKTTNFVRQHVIDLMFMLSIFLFRIPPFYVIINNNPLFLTYNIGRALSILIIFQKIVTNRNSISRAISVNKHVFFFLLLFFLSQSIPIIKAINIVEYLKKYKDFIFFIIIFIDSYLLSNRKTMILYIYTLLIASLVSLGIQVIMYHFTYIFKAIKINIEQNYYQFFEFQKNRGRFFGETFDEVITPLIFVIYRKGWASIFFYSLLILITYTTYISNWRTKTIMFIFAVIFTGIFIYFKKSVKLLTIGSVVVLIFTIAILANVISINTTGTSVNQRLLLLDSESLNTTTVRLKYWNTAKEIGMSNFLLGVGLGNYFDYLSNKEKTMNSNQIGLSSNTKFIIIDDPHNIFLSTFVSTGIIGLISISILIFYFAYSDLLYFFNNKKDGLAYLLSISNWTLFLFSLFNPFLYWQYLYFFALLRGSLEKIKYLKK